MSVILKTENLTYTYSQGTPFEKTAVKNVNLEIEDGRLIGIIGHTGSGKSTLIRHFNGLLKPTGGRIFLNGKDIWSDKKSIRDVRFKVGLVFQYPEYQLFEETVYKDISFGAENMGLSKAETDKRVRETAALLGIDDYMLKKSPFELSGGQKRRVAIAGVMVMRPQILILDEPTAGLDPKGRDEILGIISDYRKRTGSTIMLVSHSMEDVAGFAEKIIVMNKSELFCYDDTLKVFERSDEIINIGLDVPQITGIYNTLKAKGLNLEGNAYTVKYACEHIAGYLKERGV